MTCEYLDRDLDRFVDGELGVDADTAARLHVGTCSECRARVRDRQTLTRALRQLPYDEAPARLRAAVAAGARRSRASRAAGMFAAAAAAVIIAAGGAAVLVRPGLQHGDPAAVEHVVDSHVRSLMADHLVDVRSTDQHTVKPWFSGKLEFSPPVADLGSIGFPLVGGRVELLDGRPTAALVYQRRQHVINLFVGLASEGARGAPSAGSSRGFHVRHWTSGGMSFWAVSDVSDDELDRFVAALPPA